MQVSEEMKRIIFVVFMAIYLLTGIYLHQINTISLPYLLIMVTFFCIINLIFGTLVLIDYIIQSSLPKVNTETTIDLPPEYCVEAPPPTYKEALKIGTNPQLEVSKQIPTTYLSSCI